jgi:hypothetical protein
MRYFLLCLLLFFSAFRTWSLEPGSTTSGQPTKKVLKRYEYFDRFHTTKEIASHLTIAYAGMFTGYLLTQTDTINEKGSWKNYGNHFGELTTDKDNPIWNLVGHPYTGSQTFLYFRALGYDRLSSLHLSFWTSALFETTIEIYTEPASIQDLYQTPILGSALGYVMERTSLFLLNNDNATIFKFVGHLMNPMTLFGFTEVETTIYPEISKNKQGLHLVVSY